MFILVILCSFKNVPVKAIHGLTFKLTRDFPIHLYSACPWTLNFVLLSVMLELNHSRINMIPLYTTRSKIRNKKITVLLPFYRNSISYVKVYILYIYF